MHTRKKISAENEKKAIDAFWKSFRKADGFSQIELTEINEPDPKAVDARIDELIDKVLWLEPKGDGFYETQWGKKTRQGLKETIKNVLNLN